MSFKHLLSTTTTRTADAINAIGDAVGIASGFVSKHLEQQDLRREQDIEAFSIELDAEISKRIDTALKSIKDIDVDMVSSARQAARAKIEAFRANRK